MLAEFTQFREVSSVATNAQKPRVVLISAGPGNAQDGNFYPPDVLERDASIFEGVKCFLNHPGRMEEENRPEREVQIIAGWFENVRAERDAQNVRITGDLVYTHSTSGELTDAGDEARKLCESAIAYSKRFPDKVLLGFSINADGESQAKPTEELTTQYASFTDALSERPAWHVVDKIVAATSVDLVTYPARGGRVLGLHEAERRMRTALTEADTIERRLEMFQDLRDKTDRAADTRDPQVIQDMITAVSTYIDDEIQQLRDEVGKEDAPMNMDDKVLTDEEKALAERKARAEGDKFALYAEQEPPPSENPDADADAEKSHMEPDPDAFGARAAAAEADGYMKYAEQDKADEEPLDAKDDEEKPAVLKCAACGYEASAATEAKKTEALEAARKQVVELTAQLAAQRRQLKESAKTALAETERKELATLRAEKRYRNKFARAQKVCREAGNFMEPKDLMPFDETQWDALLRFADSGQRTYGNGETVIPMTPPQAPRTARALYESLRQ